MSDWLKVTSVNIVSLLECERRESPYAEGIH